MRKSYNCTNNECKVRGIVIIAIKVTVRNCFEIGLHHYDKISTIAYGKVLHDQRLLLNGYKFSHR